MEGPVIFIACLVAVTLGILVALYAVARDAKPKHQDTPFSLYRQPNDDHPPRTFDQNRSIDRNHRPTAGAEPALRPRQGHAG